jgi:hypothetical protein
VLSQALGGSITGEKKNKVKCPLKTLIASFPPSIEEKNAIDVF